MKDNFKTLTLSQHHRKFVTVVDLDFILFVLNVI